uniref:Uncharacterized protein n=1 Tax=Anguilla anguilla TaxID=7936 RepID=A0A0E9TA31_ANGAN
MAMDNCYNEYCTLLTGWARWHSG